MSRDFDSNSGISVNLSRDWTSLGWQVCPKSKNLPMPIHYKRIPSTITCMPLFLASPLRGGGGGAKGVYVCPQTCSFKFTKYFEVHLPNFVETALKCHLIYL